MMTCLTYGKNKQAKIGSRTKDDLTATLSHEIRTPLNSLLAMTELLLKTDLNQHQKRLAQTALCSAEALLRIVNTVLDFSKIEAGQLQLDNQEFDVCNLLEETAEIMSIQAHQKGLELILEITSGAKGTFRGDAGRLRQVLINLLSNAIKFTESGEIRLRVTTQAEQAPQARTLLRFEVIDSGIGIPLNQQQLIFEHYVQGDNLPPGSLHGNGLGLAIARQLVELSGRATSHCQ